MPAMVDSTHPIASASRWKGWMERSTTMIFFLDERALQAQRVLRGPPHRRFDNRLPAIAPVVSADPDNSWQPIATPVRTRPFCLYQPRRSAAEAFPTLRWINEHH